MSDEQNKDIEDTVNDLIEVAKSIVQCPRCGINGYTPYEDLADASSIQKQLAPPPALSRFDNETLVCSECGTNEALMNWQGIPLTGPDEWGGAE